LNCGPRLCDKISRVEYEADHADGFLVPWDDELVPVFKRQVMRSGRKVCPNEWD
jgi:hypothetical protein